jgi:hypothetical protein
MIIFGNVDDDDDDDDVEVEVEADPFQKRHNHINRLDGVTGLSLRRILFHETKQSIATTAGSSTYEDLSDGMMSKEDGNERQGMKQRARRYQAVMGFRKERLPSSPTRRIDTKTAFETSSQLSPSGTTSTSVGIALRLRDYIQPHHPNPDHPLPTQTPTLTS